MIKDVEIHQEQDRIKVVWKWNGEEAEKVRILYKKKDSLGGDGTDFIQDEIGRIPHIEIGTVERALCGEQGLYTFTFLPYGKAGSPGEKVTADDIMLGKRLEITWNARGVRGGTLICFRVFGSSLPAGLLTVKRENVKCVIWEEVTSETRLLFPDSVLPGDYELSIKPPYDKVYRLYQR